MEINETKRLIVSSEELETINPKDVYNVNVGSNELWPGVMGHVDSGKTSLCKLMTMVASTASLDKNPQSQERGMTLDIGFSAFYSQVPSHLSGIIR